MAFVIDFIQIFNFFYFSRNFLNSEINVLKLSFSNVKKISSPEMKVKVDIVKARYCCFAATALAPDPAMPDRSGANILKSWN